MKKYTLLGLLVLFGFLTSCGDPNPDNTPSPIRRGDCNKPTIAPYCNY